MERKEVRWGGVPKRVCTDLFENQEEGFNKKLLFTYFLNKVEKAIYTTESSHSQRITSTLAMLTNNKKLT